MKRAVVHRCPTCRYSLDGLGVSGACPECGDRFEVAIGRRARRRRALAKWNLTALFVVYLVGLGSFLAARTPYWPSTFSEWWSSALYGGWFALPGVVVVAIAEFQRRTIGPKSASIALVVGLMTSVAACVFATLRFKLQPSTLTNAFELFAVPIWSTAISAILALVTSMFGARAD